MPALPHNPECKSQNCVAGIFSKRPPIVPTRLFAAKKGQVIDADDGGGQRRRRGARIKCKRNRKDVREADTVEHVKGDEPPD